MSTQASTELLPVEGPIVISQYQVLLGDIEDAQLAPVDEFDYASKQGEKAARSYIFSLRKLKARIESARKDAKAWALSYGKAVDSQAAELSQQVQALIDPHEQALKAIADAEAARVLKHREVLQAIAALRSLRFGMASGELDSQLAALKDLDISGLEEFKESAAAEKLAGIEELEAALEKAKADEAAAAELQRLREAEAQRRAAEEQARLEREAQERADRLAQEAAEEQIRESERKAAEAEAKAAEAEAKAAQAEAELQRIASAPPVAPRPAPVADEIAKPKPARRALPADLHRELCEAMAGMNRIAVADAIVLGTLHKAVCVDWGKV